MNTDFSLFTYPILSQFTELRHFCSTRDGGKSFGHYKSFNISPFSGDSAVNQQTNLAILASQIQIPANQIIFPYQTHGNRVKLIDVEYLKLTKKAQSENLSAVDAVITNLKGICIGVTTADCVPILIYDAENKAIAAVHAGWRGTCSRIVEKTLELMSKSFGTQSSKVYVSIGVSISPEVYSVGEELKTEFEQSQFPIDQIFISRNNLLFLDLWAANKWLLLKAGVPENQIEISGICTFSNSEKFFSARKLGVKSGRMLSGIMLK